MNDTHFIQKYSGNSDILCHHTIVFHCENKADKAQRIYKKCENSYSKHKYSAITSTT